MLIVGAVATGANDQNDVDPHPAPISTGGRGSSRRFALIIQIVSTGHMIGDCCPASFLLMAAKMVAMTLSISVRMGVLVKRRISKPCSANTRDLSPSRRSASSE